MVERSEIPDGDRFTDFDEYLPDRHLLRAAPARCPACGRMLGLSAIDEP